MLVALTGGSGFLGRYVIAELIEQGHSIRAWRRKESDITGLEHYGAALEWVEGELGDQRSTAELLDGSDAVVHSALYRPGAGFRGAEGDLEEFLMKNLLGTIQLIKHSRALGLHRFIFISTCAVHETIMEDRTLDEAHPLWPHSHYGAHKAAIEKFVHSYGLGEGYPICALRPTGIYGRTHRVEQSKWFELIKRVASGDEVFCSKGGKEVHAADVARAVGLLLVAEGIAGQAYNCYDQYISEYDIALLTQSITGSNALIQGEQRTPKHQIDVSKICGMGMKFGGEQLLRRTVEELIAA